MLAIIGGATGGSNSSGSGPGYLAQSEAKSTCHAAVKEQLAAPATAQFHNEQVSKTTDGSGDLQVTGSVDSENGFGALLTSSFVCTTSDDGVIMVDDPTVVPG
ncbi:MAG TPA: hypothetical protein VHD58_01105 [Mycobacteriales bacterium]|nr:hypothetical protein [Mycobacteriales bacterium]